MPIHYNRNSQFLFIGEAITDGGRSNDPEGLGFGYVRRIRDYLLARHSTTAPRISNHAEQGLRISDWTTRWPESALRERPDASWIDQSGQLTSAGHAVIAYTWLEECGLAPLATS